MRRGWVALGSSPLGYQMSFVNCVCFLITTWVFLRWIACLQGHDSPTREELESQGSSGGDAAGGDAAGGTSPTGMHLTYWHYASGLSSLSLHCRLEHQG